MTIHSDVIRKLIAVSMVLGSTSAQAQNCMQYLPGPFRTQCAEARNPRFEAKLEKCQDEARAMGLATSGRAALREYVQACMHPR